MARRRTSIAEGIDATAAPTGTVRGVADFGLGNLPFVGGVTGTSDLVVVRVASATGATLSGKTFGGSSEDVSTGIATSSLGSILLSGYALYDVSIQLDLGDGPKQEMSQGLSWASLGTDL